MEYFSVGENCVVVNRYSDEYIIQVYIRTSCISTPAVETNDTYTDCGEEITGYTISKNGANIGISEAN